MDSTEREETEEVKSESGNSENGIRTPLLVRGLVIVLLIVVLFSIYSEQFLQPRRKGTSLKDDLQKLGLAYHEFHRVHEHSPASIDQLKDFLDNPPPPPKTEGIVGPDPVSVIVLPDSLIEMIRDGRVVVIWRAALTDSGLENDQYLLAYTADVGKDGGVGLTAAGRAMELTAKAFQEFPLVSIEQTGADAIETKQKQPEKSEAKDQG